MNKEFNIKLLFRLQGGMLLLETFFLLISAVVAVIYNENIFVPFILPAIITFIPGITAILIGKNAQGQLGKRDGVLIVTTVWLLFSLFGMLPYIFSGAIPAVTDAFFETMSGFTTTGASILNNIESLPKSILFWRSITHWIGGLGIIVITMALLPMFGFSAMSLFSAEATGPTKDKLSARISETARNLFLIYIALTTSETLLLRLAGMQWFDAVCHSFATIATGGFSTMQSSIAAFNSPLIEYIIVFFMFFSGINFSIYYFVYKLKSDKLIKNDELKVYFVIVFVFTALLAGTQIIDSGFDINKLESYIRNALFVTVSTITTTGFTTVDYGTWPIFSWYLVIFLMFVGASAGSTAGGIKVVRVLIVFRYMFLEFKRFIHPNAILPLRLNEHSLAENVVARVLAFVFLYFAIVLFGSAVLSLNNMGFVESFSGMVTCISDVGPGLGSIGPAYNFSHLNDFSKWFLSVIMMVGRLEIFTVLLVFTPVFWRK